eukprot:657961-Amphidinium_carterae.2
MQGDWTPLRGFLWFVCFRVLHCPLALTKLKCATKKEKTCCRLRNGAFQWKFSTEVRRYAKIGDATRGAVLRQWHDDYATMFDPASSLDLLDAVRLLEGELTPLIVHTLPTPATDPPVEDTIEFIDISLWRFPNVNVPNNIPGSFEQLQETTQKVLPKA